MSADPRNTGLYVSGAMHAALLGVLVFGFTGAPRFDDSTEALPVESVSQSQFNEIMNGEKDAKPAPTPPARPLAAAEPPSPPLPPQPPPELKRSDDTPPPPPTPPAPPTPPPPPKPAPPPPPRPTLAEDSPEPPVKPKIVETPPPRPTPTPEKFKPDQVAKLLAKEKAEEPPKDAKPTAKPYDPSAIAKLIGQTKTADASPTGSTAQGLPNHNAQHMSISASKALDDWFTNAYLECWSPPPSLPGGEPYVPEIRVEFNSDGTLKGTPELANPPADPAWRPLAESAMRATLKCNPMKVPAQFSPYFESWRTKTIHFDPKDALG